ncbi:hypothetical protein B7494_g8173, partial [Chlorociboria aeruginascens]
YIQTTLRVFLRCVEMQFEKSDRNRGTRFEINTTLAPAKTREQKIVAWEGIASDNLKSNLQEKARISESASALGIGNNGSMDQWINGFRQHAYKLAELWPDALRRPCQQTRIWTSHAMMASDLRPTYAPDTTGPPLLLPAMHAPRHVRPSGWCERGSRFGSGKAGNQRTPVTRKDTKDRDLDSKQLTQKQRTQGGRTGREGVGVGAVVTVVTVGDRGYRALGRSLDSSVRRRVRWGCGPVPARVAMELGVRWMGHMGDARWEMHHARRDVIVCHYAGAMISHAARDHLALGSIPAKRWPAVSVFTFPVAASAAHRRRRPAEKHQGPAPREMGWGPDE